MTTAQQALQQAREALKFYANPTVYETDLAGRRMDIRFVAERALAAIDAVLASPSAGIAGDAACPMRDGYAGSTFISNASGHSLRIEYKTREQGDAAQAWLAGDAAPQEQPPRGNTQCNPHPDAPHDFDRYRSLNEDRYVCACEGWMPPAVHLAGGASQSVREQAVAYWECRSFDIEHGVWFPWGRVEGSARYPLEQRLADIRAKIAEGSRWELRALYASPLPAVQTVRTVRMLTDQQVRELMRIAHQWAGPDHADTRSDSLELALRALSHQAGQKESGNA